MNDAHTGGDSDSAAAPTSPIVPAAPGWTAHVARLVDGEAVRLFSSPIIAWEIRNEAAAPITVAPIAGRFLLLETQAPARFFDGAGEFSGVAQWADSLIEGRRQDRAAKASDADPLD